MIRFFCTATYKTAGGNLGGASFALVAADFDQARNLATRRLSIRGRRGLIFTITREA
jgi:hypothetical protein